VKATPSQREVMTTAHVSALNVVVEKEIKPETSEDVFQTPPESPESSSNELMR
jgi:ssDNA-specific exonuclease RecJ